MSFFIDTAGETENAASLPECSQNNEGPSSGLKEILEEYKASLKSENKEMKNKSEKPDIYQQFIDDRKRLKKKKRKQSVVEPSKMTKRDIDVILKKSLITPEFEKLHAIPPYEESKKKLLEERRKERAKTKGKNWFNLPATEMTKEVKHDLEVLQMRSVLDPKHFYKKNDLSVLPKYFQIGKVLDSPFDYYSDRLTKKQRKQTLVDELLADAEFNKYNKRKYREIVEEKQKTHYKAWRQAKRLKKKNKK